MSVTDGPLARDPGELARDAGEGVPAGAGRDGRWVATVKTE
jgi:hypothetical protein